MRVFVAFAHPRADSFNGAVLDELREGLLEAGHEPDVADLYAEDFHPALGAEELEGMGKAEPGPIVRSYQSRIHAADGLAFLFPIWWFGPPAMMKGFVDRVFTQSFAFRFAEGNRVVGLLHHRRALVINTAGASEAAYEAFGFHKPHHKVFCEWTLKMCGVREVRHLLMRGLATAKESTRRAYLAEARKAGRETFAG